MPNWESLVNLCVGKPSYIHMLRAYQDYRIDSGPCKGGYTNQCAVRMSVALERCGFSLDAFDPQRRVHRGRRSCRMNVPHVLGAHELARYLTRMIGPPRIFRGAAGHGAATTLRGQKGIIYFNNCFKRRRTDARKKGDHIDLWNGMQYFNQIIHVSAGGGVRARASLFERSDQVWFYSL